MTDYAAALLAYARAKRQAELTADELRDVRAAMEAELAAYKATADACAKAEAEAARCTPSQLAEQGIRMAAAAWGVQLPRRISRVRPAPSTAPSPGGRPRASYAVERDEPGGAFLRSCPNCDREFRTDNPRMTYCSTGCKKSVQYRRHYVKKSRGGL